MIVDPDFFDHWRTGMVADAINDQMAAIYIMRLWAHCQERKSDSFVMPSRGLKAQCKFPGDADVFESALIEAGFLVRSGDTITALGWADKNASLISAWGNGIKGGRPKKNPDKTQAEPMGNPTETQTEPISNPELTDSKPIRVDKRREDKKDKEPSGSLFSASRKTKLPTGFYPNENGISTAEDSGVNVAIELRKFTDYHTAKGSLMADWQAAWRTWVGNAATFARAGPTNRQASIEARNKAAGEEWLRQEGVTT